MHWKTGSPAAVPPTRPQICRGRHAAGLARFVSEGNVVVQLPQAASIEPVPPLFPADRVARRTDDALSEWGRACNQRVEAGLTVTILPKSCILKDERGELLP